MQRLVHEYREMGYSVVFVTMCPKLNDVDYRKLKESCSLIIRRRSFGRDFGAWKDSFPILQEHFPHCNEVVLTNDSVVGPVCPLKTVFDRIASSRADLIGLTESWDRAYHLQSYFLVFKGPVAIEFLKDFFGRMWLRNSRDWVIRRGEIGLSQAALRSSLRLECLCKLHELRKLVSQDQARREAATLNIVPFIRQARPQLDEASCLTVLWSLRINPTHYFWRDLIELLGFPFIKVDLLKLNPDRIVGLEAWRDVVLEAGVISPELIERHMMTQKISRVP
ncbi:conserved hypothetical protein [Afipia carboxidovorans OM5]|nr:conserved hypothetical protein [Afipia carboxidovorans OM5]